jgi:hypothetical protein
MTLEPAQTLHGYTQGHRLLARFGDLRESELHELDRLSDLSGYLPPDTSFTSYHTGFPCGRYHALACTWPDHAAPRRGTVLTHTLLIPSERWLEDPDPLRWTAMHRRPISAEEREAYARPLEGSPDTLPPPHVSAEAQQGLLALWLGQPDRPIAWVDEQPSLELVRWLWPWLWTQQRGEFAFCTFALQVRKLRGRPFDFLMMPPTAVGAFHEIGSSSGWWLDGRLRRGEPEPWVSELLERGPAALHAVFERGRAIDLPPPPQGMFRAAQRYWELSEGATLRLSAARARLDMLARLWPDLPVDHPAMLEAIAQLIERQADAPLAPRPLWALQSLLAQPAVRAQLDTETPLSRKISASVREQVSMRLREAEPSLMTRALVELYATMPEVARVALREAVGAAARTTHDPAWGPALLDHATQESDAELELELGRVLPIATLERWATSSIDACEPTERDELRERIAGLALERLSPELARAAWPDAPEEGLHASAAIVSTHPSTLASFEALLAGEDGESRLAWCLDCRVDALRGLAIRTGAQLLRARKPSPAKLAEQCQGHAWGAPIFLSACDWAPERELESVLRDHDDLALAIVRFLLDDSGVWSATLGNVAVRVVPAAHLWSAATWAALESGKGSSSQIALLGVRLIEDVLTSAIQGEGAGMWLGSARLGQWFARGGSWELDRAISKRGRGALHNLVTATAHALRTTPQRGPAIPLLRCLPSISRDELMETTDALADLMNVAPSSSDVGLDLRAELLAAVRRHPITGGWRLAEIAFPSVYSNVVRGVAIERASWWLSFSWDRAKHWRHWLLDTWVERSWPTESLVRCLAGDAELARRVFRRASRRSSETKAWLRALQPALVREPVLLRVWQDAVS